MRCRLNTVGHTVQRIILNGKSALEVAVPGSGSAKLPSPHIQHWNLLIEVPRTANNAFLIVIKDILQ